MPSPLKKLTNKKKIGLALGGGAVLGAAHAGILRALEEAEINISYIAGTSIGGLVAALYAFGKNWEEIADIAKKMSWMEVSVLSLSQFGLLSNEKLGKLILEQLGDVSFEEAEIPLAMISTDISNGEKVILKEGKIEKAVMATTSIPGIFKPVEIGDRLLSDGGIVENVPITPLQEMGAEYIIAVDLNAKHAAERPDNIIEVLLNAFNFTLINATKLQTEKADLLLTPDLSSFNLIDTDQVPELIEKGYAEMKSVLEGK